MAEMGREVLEWFEGCRIVYDNKGYPCICRENQKIRIHILVWERANGKKPRGCDIHHIDGNKQNFCLGNLELLSKSDHKRIHAGWVRENSVWVAKPCKKCGRILTLDCFYPHNNIWSSLCKPCHNQQIIELKQSSPIKREEMLNQHRKSNARYKLKLKMEGRK